MDKERSHLNQSRILEKFGTEEKRVQVIFFESSITINGTFLSLHETRAERIKSQLKMFTEEYKQNHFMVSKPIADWLFTTSIDKTISEKVLLETMKETGCAHVNCQQCLRHFKTKLDYQTDFLSCTEINKHLWSTNE